ncbi:MAG: hypothetical protein ACTSX7_10020, partial [Alphaproteobacteria bacterium]
AMGADFYAVGNPNRAGDRTMLRNDTINADIRGRLNMHTASNYGAGADDGTWLYRCGWMNR